MLKKEFEKRHGEIGYRDATAGGEGYIKLPKKYNLIADDQPAAIWWIAQNMPYAKFNDLNPEQLQTIFKYMAEIKEKEVRDYYLNWIAYLYFDDTYGWFARGGRGLFTYARQLSDLHDSEKKVALKILRMLKREFMKYHYKGGYVNIFKINSLIRELGGSTDILKSVEKAQTKVITKAPRKQKKELQKQGLWATLVRTR